MDVINDFNYLIKGGLSDRDCPFTAHTRKTVPRNLDPFVQKSFLESSMIMRAGIPYGDEVRSSLYMVDKYGFKSHERFLQMSLDKASLSESAVFCSFAISLAWEMGFIVLGPNLGQIITSQ